MKKIIVLAFALFTGVLFVQAQENGMPAGSPGYYFNEFQRLHIDKPDSALYVLKQLAAHPYGSSTLQDLLHNSLAQGFLKESETYLDQLKDSVSRTFKKK